ncbi:MAG: hypothetical protein LBK58_04360 [Prevotellaceae bacterium]|jgi:hypothetical protein|nr:hypothetical protein [Prevotellaceae bacterium]
MNSNIDNTRDSIKTINEFLIDIIGALIPGIIFLVSTIVSIIFPLLIMVYNQIPKRKDSVDKIDLLIFAQGWFWLVVFFTLLILAYAIGNIFYRLDIKKIDRKSFQYEKNRCFCYEIRPIIKGLKEDEKKEDKKFKYIRYKLSFIINNLYFIKKTRKKSLDFDSFIEKYCLLLIDHLSETDRTYLQQDDHKQFFYALKNNVDELNTIAYSVYKNKDKDVITSILEKIEEKKTEKTIDSSSELKISPQNKNQEQDCSNEYIDKLKKQAEILKEFLKPYMKTKYFPDFTKKGQEREKTKLLAIGWYFLFLLRSESACDKKENCQFPYEYYNTYLIKREETHLLEYAKHWCKDERARSKNALNRLKLKLQLIANQDYNILIKNEAHIRMSSSSWYVAEKNIWINVIISLIFFILLFWEPDFYQNQYMYLIIILPVLMFLLNSFIYRSVIKYLHYQRLREIFFVLQVFDEYFGEGCIYRNTGTEDNKNDKDNISNCYKRKNDTSLLKDLHELQKMNPKCPFNINFSKKHFGINR